MYIERTFIVLVRWVLRLHLGRCHAVGSHSLGAAGAECISVTNGVIVTAIVLIPIAPFMRVEGTQICKSSH